MRKVVDIKLTTKIDDALAKCKLKLLNEFLFANIFALGQNLDEQFTQFQLIESLKKLEKNTMKREIIKNLNYLFLEIPYLGYLSVVPLSQGKDLL